MSIIQSIRDKGAAIVIGVIALSLIGFLLMDARSGAAKGLFGGNSTVVGTVNGKDIEYDEFNAKVKDQETQYQQQGASMRPQIMDNVWNQMVGERLMSSEFDKLGIAFTPKEMSAIMFSEDAPQQLKQAFTDQKTGQYDIEKARQWWAQTRKSKNDEQRQMINSQVIDPMRLQALYTKYTSLIAGSMYTPSWMAAEQSEEDSKFANISYVAIPYTAISDSAVKVTDDDIENYLEKNKEKYKQDGGRMISYVTFSAAASGKDTAAAKSSVETLKPQFAADTNAKAFVARNTSAINYFDGYTMKSKLQMPSKDSITNLSKGSVFGPYIDGKNYVVAKMIDVKQVPDSVKVRHILIKIADTKGEVRADSTARKLIDSIALAVKNGADFNQLVLKYSDDEGSKNTKGEYKFSSSSQLVDSFYQTAFYYPVGTKKIVKGESQEYVGYHYIEVLDQSKFESAYKIAYLAKEIIPSDETSNGANASATKLSGMARDSKAFDKYIKDNGIQKIDVPGIIKENDYQLGGLQDARAIIKWAFDAKEGEVSEPFSIRDQFVVAVVDKKVNEGLPDVKTARLMVEALIRNTKKGDEIKKKLGTPASLEAAGAMYQRPVLTTADSTLTFNALIINGIGNEPKVAGAAFNKDYQTKISPAIAGSTGVFLIKVNSLNNKPENTAAAKQQQSMKFSQAMQSAVGKSFEALKKQADIKDKRSKFF